jgi:hypothetical protein
MLEFVAKYPYGYHNEYERFFRERPFDIVKRDHDERHHEGLHRIRNHFMSGESQPFQEGLIQSLEFIGQLASVDGAVIVSYDLKVLAFGAKIKPIDTDNRPNTIMLLEPIEGSLPEEISLSGFGGTRHQSAAQFVFDQRQSVAFVVSQDRIITMLTWDKSTDRVTAVRHIELTLPL